MNMTSTVFKFTGKLDNLDSFTQIYILLLKGFNHMLKDFVPCAVSVRRFCSAVQVFFLPFVLCRSSDILMLGLEGSDDNQVTEALPCAHGMPICPVLLLFLAALRRRVRHRY